MNTEEMRRMWQERSEVAFGEVTQWHQEHPKATLAEIEAVIDSKIMASRAAMIKTRHWQVPHAHPPPRPLPPSANSVGTRCKVEGNASAPCRLKEGKM